jgi:hypothetical protein
MLMLMLLLLHRRRVVPGQGHLMGQWPRAGQGLWGGARPQSALLSLEKQPLVRVTSPQEQSSCAACCRSCLFKSAVCQWGESFQKHTAGVQQPLAPPVPVLRTVALPSLPKHNNTFQPPGAQLPDTVVSESLKTHEMKEGALGVVGLSQPELAHSRDSECDASLGETVVEVYTEEEVEEEGILGAAWRRLQWALGGGKSATGSGDGGLPAPSASSHHASASHLVRRSATLALRSPRLLT